jgi:energy-coupling factor transporter ATP-binding protein EcfA2
MTPVIEAEDLRFCFEPGREVLRKVSLRVLAGERVAIAGANGAGKSTLLWCLLGLHRAEGRLRLFGLPPRQARSRVGVVFQNPEDQLFMPTILEDAALPLINRGIGREPARERARQALAAVGLESEAERPARRLSLGQRKRAAIAAALACDPELLVLDEPTAELDGRAVRLLAAVLERLPVTMLIASHDLAFLRRLATRALILRDGSVLAEGDPERLFSNEALLEEAGLI